MHDPETDDVARPQHPPVTARADEFAAIAQRYLDGLATDDDVVRLDAALRSDPAARDDYLRMVDIHASLADERTWVRRSDPVAVIVREELAAAAERPGPRHRGLMAALAVALTIGLAVGAGLASAFGLPLRAWRTMVLSDGFEAGIDPESRGIPRSPATWGGDFSRCVGSEQGVEPHQGTRMLQLLRADYEGKGRSGGYTADMYRLVDLRPYRAEIATGRASLHVAARFNAAPFPDGERYEFATTLYAFGAEADRSPPEPPDTTNLDAALAVSQNGRGSLDRDAATWQLSECDLWLPAHAEFVFVRLWVNHATPAQRRETFPGHFIDSVEVSLGTHGRPQP